MPLRPSPSPSPSQASNLADPPHRSVDPAAPAPFPYREGHPFLVDPETFDKLARFFAARQEVTQQYAERALGQFLVFLKAHADGLNNDPEFGLLLPTGESYRVVPTAPVDAVWHACLQNTEPYATACDAIAGGFVHHRPILTEAMQDGTAKQYTMTALAETGYAIDMEFWDGEAESCCPPNPGV